MPGPGRPVYGRGRVSTLVPQAKLITPCEQTQRSSQGCAPNATLASLADQQGRRTGSDAYSITEYQRSWNENERQAYRVQNEFRELWPEFETPNELAVQIVKQVNRRRAKRDAAKLPMTLQVEA